MRTLIASVVIGIALSGPISSTLESQTPDQDQMRFATRVALEARAARLEELARTSADAAQRERAADQAALIRQRLEDGDFVAGDRVLLTVAGESTLTDTFTVREGRVLELPGIGAVPLVGVLRTELGPFLRDTLSTYLREPHVTARALIRLSITGEVVRPGFYALPADAVLSDVLMMAGGMTTDASTADLRVERVDRTVWKGERLQTALTRGETIEEMALRSGDRLVVPRAATPWGVREVMSLAVGALAGVYAIVRIIE